MFSGTFLKKYLVRVVKLMTLVLICHQVFKSKLLGYSPKGLQWLYTSTLLICAGSLLPFRYIKHLSALLQPSRQQRLWLYFHYIKLVIAILVFTPLIKTLPLNKNERIDLQFTVF